MYFYNYYMFYLCSASTFCMNIRHNKVGSLLHSFHMMLIALIVIFSIMSFFMNYKNATLLVTPPDRIEAIK